MLLFLLDYPFEIERVYPLSVIMDKGFGNYRKYSDELCFPDALKLVTATHRGTPGYTVLQGTVLCMWPTGLNLLRCFRIF